VVEVVLWCVLVFTGFSVIYYVYMESRVKFDLLLMRMLMRCTQMLKLGTSK